MNSLGTRNGRELSRLLLVLLIMATLSSQVFSQGLSSFTRPFRRNYPKSAHQGHCKNNYKFDYVQLTLMWGPGSCSTSPKECVREVASHFTVHGMWPTINGTQEPSDCCFDNTFNMKALDDIMPDLNEYWFSYYDSNSNKGFWSHEWLKHGTCSRDIESLRGEARYFGNTVKLAKQLPILESLNKTSIVPSDTKSYPAGAIYKALAPIAQGKVLQLTCDYEHDQPTPILTGVAFCYNIDMRPADCPDTKPKCRRNLIFPKSSKRARFTRG